MRFIQTLSALALMATLATPSFAQNIFIPGTDVELGLLDAGSDWSVLGRTGTFPNGVNGAAMSTTSCNPGSVNVPWQQAMAENHPLIAFMAVRENAGDTRLEQISQYSWVKHGFFALSNSQCYPCQNPSNGTFLGVGCSDTYGISNNGDRFWLGPAEEIDPWDGTWNSFGSFFDCPTGTGCNGGRSYFGSEPNSVNHRVTMTDADLNTPGDFYYYGYYVIRGEPENVRVNNMNSRRFTPSWTGSSWNTSESGSNPHVQGTILQRWTGATINSNLNTNGGQDRDGRVYVAYKVTDNGNGTWHYEYAAHNRDNNGGIGAFTVPTGNNVTVTGLGFHDVDENGGNQWSMVQTGNEIQWSTNNNPLMWNSMFNFWFDADAAPVNGNVELGQFNLNPSAASSFNVTAQRPGDGSGVPSPFTSSCNGDGGDQMGCTDCPCNNNASQGSVGGCLNSAGTAMRLNASGSDSISAADLRFEANGAPPANSAVLTSGNAIAPANAANPCFGQDSGVTSFALDSLRCSVQGVLRHGVRSSDNNGDIGLTSNGWGTPSGFFQFGAFVAGSTKHFQIVSRDDIAQVCNTGQTTTQAVSVNFTP